MFELIFLGTGTSAGVPMIACDCPTCQSDDPRDRRTRPSVLVRYSGGSRGGGGGAGDPIRQVLIDTTPELRLQALSQKLSRLDGVFYTHGHADHIFGLDDLRRFNAVMHTPLDIYAEPSVLDLLHRTFFYVFAPHTNVNQTFVPQLVRHPIEPGAALDLFGARFTGLRLLHGGLPILGYRIDFAGRSLAYCTDVSAIPPETYPLLAGLDLLVLDGLRHEPHPTHLTIAQALDQIAKTQPRRALLTHIAHDIRHAQTDPTLPPGVALAYDGLRVTLEAAPA
jgi:phosphoribosyl 1,2-cyclic phosphate phosphodiesterase